MAKGILTVMMLSGVPTQTTTPASSFSTWYLSIPTTTSMSSFYHFTERRTPTAVFLS
jgi:hypothetical protein